MDKNIADYIATVPEQSQPLLKELREIVLREAPHVSEVISYGIIGYKTDEKRAKLYISGWSKHVSIHPLPSDVTLRQQLKPYIKGKGTLQFPIDTSLPTDLIKKIIKDLLA